MKQPSKGSSKAPACIHDGVEGRNRSAADPVRVARAARLFRALGDGPHLRLLTMLGAGERCVGELVTEMGDKFSTVSQRLRVLRTEGLVAHRRAGLHVYYSLADRHVAALVAHAL